MEGIAAPYIEVEDEGRQKQAENGNPSPVVVDLQQHDQTIRLSCIKTQRIAASTSLLPWRRHAQQDMPSPDLEPN